MSFLRLIPAFFLVLFFLRAVNGQAQWVDNFSDGNFTDNPTWTGDENSFIVENQVLSSKDSTLNNTFYLSTPSTLAMQASWECWVNLRFATSGSNYADFWLISNNANLKDATAGYFIRIGDTPDEISLHRKNGSTSTKIIDGRDGVVRSSSNNVFKLKATRSSSGDWLLLRDSTGIGNNYVLEGSVNDLTHTTSTHGGVLIRQSTASFFGKHFFDNCKVEEIVPDIMPPTATVANALAANRLEILFSEPVSEVSASQLINYSVNNGIGNPTSVNFLATSPARVELTFASNFANAQAYSVTVNNISDLAGNAMTDASVLNFNFVAPEIAGFREILITEFMADETPKVGQPLCEWIELYNPTNKTFQLGGFTVWDASATSGAAIGNYSFGPGEYVLLTRAANLDSFPNVTNKVFCTIPSLNNSGDDIILRRPDGAVIDGLTYADTWYKDPVKRNGGWSLELINPISPCPSGIDNWIASTHQSGGTPGRQNSVYSTNPDLTPPAVASFNLLTNSTIEVLFSKFMDSVSIRSLANYSISGSTVTNVASTFPFNLVTLTLDAALLVGTINTLVIRNLRDCSGNNLSVTNISIGLGATPAPGDLVINELYPDENPSNGLPGFEFMEVYNKSNRLLSLDGWSMQDPGARGFFPDGTVIFPDSFLIVAPTNGVAPYSAYGSTTGLSRWPSLNNDRDTISLINPAGVSVQTLAYELSWYQDNAKANGGWTLEQINPTTTCPPGPANWIASVAAIGGTPGKRNSVYSTAPDITRPEFVSFRFVSPTAMQITFSKGMDSLSLATIGNYTVPGLTITSAIPFNFFLGVTLSFSSSLDSGRAYNITLTTNLRDCGGNRLPFTTLPFGIGASPKPGQLVINELYPDESPSIGLPVFEFVELYNASDKILDLTGCALSSNSSRGRIPDNTSMAPGEYLILVGSTAANAYRSLGKTVAVVSMPTLNNTSMQVFLRNKNNVLLHSISYNLSWYRDVTKQNGGWSLEMIDPLYYCTGALNWTASEAEIGGTPGVRNSVAASNPDLTPPGLLEAAFLDSVTVILYISEDLDSLQAMNSATYIVSPNVEVLGVLFPAGRFDRVYLKLNSPGIFNTNYTVTVRNLQDCSGNVQTVEQVATFVRAYSPTPGDVVINELLSDPLVGGVDFVELYNTTNKSVDLVGCKLANARGSIQVISEEPYILKPNGYALMTPDAGLTLRDYPKSKTENFVSINSFPAYNIDSGTVRILNASDQTLDRFFFSQRMHFRLIDNTKGISLERISAALPTNNPDNWKSASSIVGYATPGYLNSQGFGLVPGTDELEVTPSVFSPDEDGDRDFAFINVNVAEPGFVANMWIFDSRGRIVKTVLQNELLGVKNSIRWDGLRDDNSKAPIGAYMVMAELYNLEGKKKVIKKPVAIASYFK